MLQGIYDAAKSGQWAEINPFKCPCRGGWFLSDVDTWHACSVHNHGAPHPDDESDNDFNHSAHRLYNMRAAYCTFRAIAANNGISHHDFEMACRRVIGCTAPTAKDWVNAADDVAEMCCRDVQEATALRFGYSCALEMQQAEDAMIERAEFDANYVS